MKPKSNAYRIRRIKKYLYELSLIQSKKPNNLYEVQVYWINKIQELQLNK